MNAVEIEEAISELSERYFNPDEFAFDFLRAFGNKEATIKRLSKGKNNKSDLENGLLQYNNIHIAVCDEGEVSKCFDALNDSPATHKQKAKFTFATDGFYIEAADVLSGETLSCKYHELADNFGFFLPLAGITTIKAIRESSFDIKATARLNKLYVELLDQNPEWASLERKSEMNHFMARLIFCFFAEDTEIFHGEDLFTATIEQMSAGDASNTDEVIGEIFKAMNMRIGDRTQGEIRSWANNFPYVNGGLFSGSLEVPKFSRIARSYLLHVGKLNWKKINPDIFGSMIQAVADDSERGSLGMHYTSVPNILKLLNPLFLDELRQKLEEAGDNQKKLLNLKKRLAKIRVFDPACGSGNFLVIAYKQLREIEAEINKRRGDSDARTTISVRNFRGIEINDFPAEIARLALIIAEYQCDVLYRGQQEALLEFLPLDAQNWIVCGNALRLDWLAICPPSGKKVRLVGDDLFSTPLDQSEIDFSNEGGETYICGNPPYLGSTFQTKSQKSDLELVFKGKTKNWKSLDYVTAWFLKAVEYGVFDPVKAAFVSTNSICQGSMIPSLWPLIFDAGFEIDFAYRSFKWANLASHNAGVTVIIVGINNKQIKRKRIFHYDKNQELHERKVEHINAYLVEGQDVLVKKSSKPINELSIMDFGNKATDGGNLILTKSELDALNLTTEQRSKFIRPFLGSAEVIKGLMRYCIWVKDDQLEEALTIKSFNERFENVRAVRMKSPDKGAHKLAEKPYQMREMNEAIKQTIVVPAVSSENRGYLPVNLLNYQTIISNSSFAVYDPPIWNLAILASKIHLVWIKTVCGKLKTDFRYSNTMGWNTFPLPKLTEKNKADLSRCAEDILLAREAHFPATIADLYKPDQMPDNLREAHERNDEALERIYIGRRFRNDSERLEKLFELYAKMTASENK